MCSGVRDEYCLLFPTAKLCSTRCGFELDSAGACRSVSAEADVAESTSTAPIIGGQGKFRYQYMPDRLQPPVGAALVNCHGWAVDKEENIYLTYQNDGVDPHCLIRWNKDGLNASFAGNGTPELCSGTPHGLKISTEGDAQFLYHANNAQKLAKTTLDGEIVWIVNGPFGQNSTCTNVTCPNNSCACTDGNAPYIPTWFAIPPGKYGYLCDGYGSDRVFSFDLSSGNFTGEPAHQDHWPARFHAHSFPSHSKSFPDRFHTNSIAHLACCLSAISALGR